jgi:hypothetical protein
VLNIAMLNGVILLLYMAYVVPVYMDSQINIKYLVSRWDSVLLFSHRKYMFISCHQNARQNHNIEIINETFENMVKCKYLRMAITNHNYIHEEVTPD